MKNAGSSSCHFIHSSNSDETLKDTLRVANTHCELYPLHRFIKLLAFAKKKKKSSPRTQPQQIINKKPHAAAKRWQMHSGGVRSGGSARTKQRQWLWQVRITTLTNTHTHITSISLNNCVQQQEVEKQAGQTPQVIITCV